MRVLFITSSYPAHAGDPRGAFIHELARALVVEGVEITVLAPGAPGAPLREVRDGVRVHRARYWTDRWQGLASGLSGIVPNLRHKPWLVFQVPPLLLALTWHAIRLGREADVIHAHWVYPSGVAGLAAARRNRKPLVLTSHGGDLNLAAKVPPLRALAAFVAKRADACLGVSQAMVGRFVQLGIRRDRVHCVPLGVSVPLDIPTGGVGSAPPQDATGFAAFPGLRIIFVGSLVPRKSVDTLIEALRLLGARAQEVACLIVGTGPCESRLRQLASGIPGGLVTFVGGQPPAKVPTYLRLAEVLVLPSRSEGLPLVLVEAMAHGLAVIASDIEGCREVIRNGVTGYLFPKADSRALADLLTGLLDAPGSAQRLGLAGRESVLAEGRTFPTSAVRHTRVYRQIAPDPETR